MVLLGKTVELKYENTAQTTFRLDPAIPDHAWKLFDHRNLFQINDLISVLKYTRNLWIGCYVRVGLDGTVTFIQIPFLI
jgi:hypothetical protein